MNTSWLIDTHGDPLGVVQQVMTDAWEQFNLESMLVSMNGSEEPHLVKDPEQLNQVNPFKPLMTKNVVKFLPDLIEQFPNSQVGMLVRPCEMRALDSKAEREAINLDNVLTICIDCLGTYPTEDYQWRAERKGSQDRLAWESLHFARQGGIAAYRFRSACQSCQTPIGKGANINIGVIGLPVRQKILIDVREQETALRMKHDPAISQEDQSLIFQREYIVAKLLQRGSQTRQRLIDNLEGILPRDLDAMLNQFEACGECRECFEACPICAAEYPAKDTKGYYLREDVKQWMVSCAGCGMCEQSCPNHLPLVTIFNNIRAQLLDQMEANPIVH